MGWRGRPRSGCCYWRPIPRVLLGPMTAAAVALGGAGGSVTPSGDASGFGLEGAEAATAIDITPLHVSLVGVILLSWFSLRSLRAAGVVGLRRRTPRARGGGDRAVRGDAGAGRPGHGHGVITLDGGALGLDDLPGDPGTGSDGIGIPGLGDLRDLGGLGDLGGLLPDRLGDLVDAEAAFGFGVDTGPTLLGGAAWATGVLIVALLASRRAPLPPGWQAAHRVVRPAAPALVTCGLFVPWDGEAWGAPALLLPAPLDDLLVYSGRPVTLGRLAELEGRVWLPAVVAGLALLLAVWCRRRVRRWTRPPVAGYGIQGRWASRGGARCGWAWRPRPRCPCRRC
ncbi:streptophobe family protein [Streptomyces pharetrae]